MFQQAKKAREAIKHGASKRGAMLEFFGAKLETDAPEPFDLHPKPVCVCVCLFIYIYIYIYIYVYI